MIAIIESGSKQYMVEKGQTIEVELIKAEKEIEFKPLLIIDGDKVHIGKPTLASATVKANIATDPVKGEKIQVLKYKPKSAKQLARATDKNSQLLQLLKLRLKAKS